MIARTWHGSVLAEQADAYHRYLLLTGVAEVRATAGNQGVYLLRKDEGESVKFTFVSLWDTLDSIRAFAGEPIDKARYYPEDYDFLIEMSERVEHHEVLASPMES